MVRHGARLFTRFNEVHVQWLPTGDTREDVPILLADDHGNDGDPRREGRSARSAAGENGMYDLPHVGHSKTGTALPNREIRASHQTPLLLFELTVDSEFSEYQIDGIRNRTIQVEAHPDMSDSPAGSAASRLPCDVSKITTTSGMVRLATLHYSECEDCQ